MSAVFPFTAIVGQDQLKLALILAAIDPDIGGVLIMGDRGTGKSTAVRALAELLPGQKATKGCPYGCLPIAGEGPCADGCPRPVMGRVPSIQRKPPVIDLPLGVSEDRVTGALDLERALAAGERVYEPGLLANANRGFLYIDEVNLLEDHLVDLLLDAAASGVNLVERDGLSVRHPAAFVLIGTGNPEEGDLRPQLQDRFGLAVEVRTPTRIDQRVEVIRSREAFDRDPEAFYADFKHKEGRLRGRIQRAFAALATTEVPSERLEQAARLCLALGTDGLRGELTIMRAARALAAFNGVPEVTSDHIREVAVMVLAHRLRRDPLDETSSAARVDRALDAEIALA